MMLRSITMAVLVGTFLGAPVVHATDVPTDACVAHSTASLDSLVRGDYAGARKDFSPATAQALDADKLKQVWAQLQAKIGTYHRHAAPARQTVQGHSFVVTPVTFAMTPLDFVVACDDQDRIATFSFVPPIPTEVKSRTEASGIRVQALAVNSPLGPLQGALTLPVGNGPFPAVLLVGGSGGHDRDESIGPNKPFRDVAQGLAAAGIASLRYDKRTFTYRKQSAAEAGFTVDDEVTDDALSALKLLGSQPRIDATRLFVLGHSLGAMMAPRIGQRDPQLAGLILLAAPARRLLDVLAEQSREHGARVGATKAQIAAGEQAIAAEQQRLDKAGPAHLPQGSFGGVPQSYWLSLHDYPQVVVAKTLAMPMLILQGGSDFQVSPKEDYARWQQALAGRPHVAFHLYPGLSHLFMPAGKTGTVADYDIPGHVDVQVVRDIAAWVKAQPAHS